jgi:hypothetical protein
LVLAQKLALPLADPAVVREQVIHRALEAEVPILVEESGVNFGQCRVGKAWLGQERQHRYPLLLYALLVVRIRRLRLRTKPLLLTTATRAVRYWARSDEESRSRRNIGPDLPDFVQASALMQELLLVRRRVLTSLGLVSRLYHPLVVAALLISSM